MCRTTAGRSRPRTCAGRVPPTPSSPSRSPSCTSCARIRGRRSRSPRSAPSLPQLLAPPRLVERPAPLGTRPTRSRAGRAGGAGRRAAAAARRRADAGEPPAAAGAGVVTSGEMRVAAADPAPARHWIACKWGASLSRDTTFVPAPAYDEEHPEELSYRPFPIAPFLTATASRRRPGAGAHGASRSRQDAGDAGSGRLGAADAAAARPADGADSCGRSSSRARRSTSRA